MSNDAPGPRAVTLLDRLLRERPERSGDTFSEATRCLAAYRDALIGRYREGQLPRARLDDINAVLSVVIGGHFPLGSVPWDHIQRARERLATLVRMDGSPRA